MHKKFGKDRACGSRDILADRQTDRHTDVLITILCNRFHGRNKYKKPFHTSMSKNYLFSYCNNFSRITDTINTDMWKEEKQKVHNLHI